MTTPVPARRELAELIRERMTALDLDWKEVVYQTGFSRSLVFDLMAGRAPDGSLVRYTALAVLLGVSLEDLAVASAGAVSVSPPLRQGDPDELLDRAYVRSLRGGRKGLTVRQTVDVALALPLDAATSLPTVGVRAPHPRPVVVLGDVRGHRSVLFRNKLTLTAHDIEWTTARTAREAALLERTRRAQERRDDAAMAS